MIAPSDTFDLSEEQAANLRILVVDDSSVMRKIIVTSLRESGFKNTITADDGDRAWEIIQKGGIQMIVSDHKMPNMTGNELLAKVRGHEQYKDLPFIMVTAEAFRENVMEAIKLGVSNYVVKPFSAEQLRRKIIKVLEYLDQQQRKPPEAAASMDGHPPSGE